MNPKKKKFRADGFTVIELLIVVAAGSIIMLALFSMYIVGQRYFITESASANVLRDNRDVLKLISRDIKEATQVLSNWDIYNSSTNCLVLQTPSLDSSGMIIDIDNEFDHIIYRLNPQDPSRLERIIDSNDGVSSRGDSARIMTDKVNSFLLGSEGVDLSAISDFPKVSSIEISLTTTQARFDRTFQQTLNTKIKLRNK